MDGYRTDAGEEMGSIAVLDRPAPVPSLPQPCPPRKCRAPWDKTLLTLIVLASAVCIPLIPRSTDNPQHLAAFINDEPAITCQLVGMAVRPYGNPANYLKDTTRMPKEWGIIQYPEYIYYGGGYLGAGFLLYGPLKFFGSDDFPTAPIALRTVSFLSGLVSLILVYLLGKRLGGQWAGLGAALLLLTDTSFFAYFTIIHPDSTMLMLALCGLLAAIKHAESGTLRSLAGLGILAGLVHGTKMGGPWMIPMSGLAVLWALRSLETGWTWKGLVGRFALLGTCAAAGFVVSTPYAVLDTYYLRMIKNNAAFFRTSPWAEASPLKWVDGLWEYFGMPLFVLSCLGLVFMLCKGLWRKRSPALILPCVLCLSVLLWYSLVIRLWVCVPYLLTALAIVYLGIGVLVGSGLHWLRDLGSIGRCGATGLAIGLVGLIAYYPGVTLGMYMARELQRDHTAGVQIGRWAEKHLPKETKILYDDAAYFDPGRFPNAHLHNGLMTYGALEQKRPDYFLLNSTIYSAPHYVELRKTQTFSRGKEGDFSVLLYQDVLDRGGVPEAEPVITLTPVGLQGARLEVLVATWRDVLTGETRVWGHELRLYRYRPTALPESKVKAN